MTYSQLYVNLKCNNQVTIGLQNTRLINDAGKSAYLTHNQVAERQIEKHFPLRNVVLKYKQIAVIDRRNSAKTKKSKAFLHWALGVKVRPLDITEKLQRTLESFASNLSGLASLNLYAKVLIVFGQYRKHNIKRFGNIQAQHIHECGAAMEMNMLEPSFCHVTTLTLPSDTKEAFECLAAYSGYAVNRLFQPIRRDYADCNKWFFVWEYQKRGALHLHIAHYHHCKIIGAAIGEKILETWHNILCDISENSGICLFTAKQGDRCTLRKNHQHQTQPMRKSVAGYFSKYASKAGQKEENNYVRKFSQMYPPSRFWGCSKQIKMIVKENSFHNCRDYTEQKDFMYFLFVRIHKMINESNIILQKNYTFKKDLTQNLCVAEGFRNVFYLSPSDYQKLLTSVRADFSCF